MQSGQKHPTELPIPPFSNKPLEKVVNIPTNQHRKYELFS